jgi:hypothetical protein
MKLSALEIAYKEFRASLGNIDIPDVSSAVLRDSDGPKYSAGRRSSKLGDMSHDERRKQKRKK